MNLVLIKEVVAYVVLIFPLTAGGVKDFIDIIIVKSGR
jgi:hypothetical protein